MLSYLRLLFEVAAVSGDATPVDADVESMPAAQATGRSAPLRSSVDPYVPAVPSPLRLSSTPTLSIYYRPTVLSNGYTNDNGHGNGSGHDYKRHATGALTGRDTNNNNFNSVNNSVDGRINFTGEKGCRLFFDRDRVV